MSTKTCSTCGKIGHIKSNTKKCTLHKLYKASKTNSNPMVNEIKVSKDVIEKDIVTNLRDITVDKLDYYSEFQLFNHNATIDDLVDGLEEIANFHNKHIGLYPHPNIEYITVHNAEKIVYRVLTFYRLDGRFDITNMLVCDLKYIISKVDKIVKEHPDIGNIWFSRNHQVNWDYVSTRA